MGRARSDNKANFGARSYRLRLKVSKRGVVHEGCESVSSIAIEGLLNRLQPVCKTQFTGRTPVRRLTSATGKTSRRGHVSDGDTILMQQTPPHEHTESDRRW